jgi:hypothetical protein
MVSDITTEWRLPVRLSWQSRRDYWRKQKKCAQPGFSALTTYIERVLYQNSVYPVNTESAAMD